VKGEFSARVRSQTCSALARLAVDRGRVDSSPLIADTFQELGTLQITEDGSSDEILDLSIQEAPKIKA